MKWTGLTGGIATGKSTAKKLIEGLGFPVIDADQISHSLSEAGAPGYVRIVSHFGQVILNPDLSLDRKKLGQMVFTDAGHKAGLEAILHPLIQAEVQSQRLAHEKSGHGLCFYDVPLLFEKNLQANFDTTLLVWCEPEIQIQRLMQRNAFTREEALLRIRNQLPLSEKVRLADHCLDNSGDQDALARQIQKLIQSLSRPGAT